MGPAELPNDASVIDSAGIEIITNHVTTGGLSLAVIDGDPVREIASEALYRVSAVTPLPEGGVAVGVLGSGTVLVYGDGSEPDETLGRTGEGPGEFREIWEVFPLPGDSIGVYDLRLQRLSVFSGDGTFGRTVDLSSVTPRAASAHVLPLDEDLAVVGVSVLEPREAQGVYRGSAPSYRIGLDGEILATYGTFSGMQAFLGDRLMGLAPFGATLSAATVGDRLVVGEGEHPELRIFDPDGTLVRIVRWPDGDRTVTQERMDAYLEFRFSESPEDETAAFRERAESMPFANPMAAHGEILADADGTLWVEEYPGPEAGYPERRGPARRWLVFGPTGVLERRIETPEGFQPMSLDGDRVWGVYRDTMDVESVRAYAIP